MSLLNRNLTTHLNRIICRNISFRKIKHWYAGLHRPSAVNPLPPYSHVVQIGDPVLRRKAEPVQLNMIQSDEIKYLISHMKTVLHKYDCVGLAAPQIGIPLKVFIMEFSKKRQKEFSSDIYNVRKMRIVPFTVLINPELRVIDYTKIILPEACESVKGFSADVPRYSEVEVSGFNENGDQIKIEADGWTARIIQHEMDHLSGKLYTDIMDKSTLCCTCWQAVNERAGKIELPFSPN